MVLQEMRYARCAIFLPTLSICLSACAPGTSATEQRRNEQTRGEHYPKVFGAEERRIARALSLGGGTQGDAKSSADDAASCVIALNFIRARFGQNVGLDAEQAKGLDSVIAQYRSRAGEKTMSATRFAQKLKAADAAFPDEAERARASLRCLQALE